MEETDNIILNDQSINNEILSTKDPEWKNEHEKILVEWADKAMCYRWLHARSHQSYSKTNTWFTIPVIIMSTLTGTANFAQDKFPEHMKTYAQMAIGTVNIFAGILTTIAQFLKISELNEAHRASSISWDKFYRNIKVELAKSRDERMHVGHMIKICKEEFDRLMETSPSINEQVIAQFNSTFPQKKPIRIDTNKEYEKPEIKRPEICNELVSTAEILYVPDISDEAIEQQASLIELSKRKQQIETYAKEIKLWSSKFEEKHNRKPLESELYDNLQEKMKINFKTFQELITKLLKEQEAEVPSESLNMV